MKQIVYVVMFNNCVSRVFSSEAGAKAFVDKQRGIEAENSLKLGQRPCVSWQYYPFALDESST